MYHLKYRECLFYILRKWRVVVIVMLLVGLLFTGRNAIKTKNNWANMQNDVDITNLHVATQEHRISELNDRITEVNDLIAERELFVAHNAPFTFDSDHMFVSSVILKFDFGKKAILDLDGNVIDEVNVEMPTGFLKVYNSCSKQIIDWEYIQEKTGLNEDYVEDFVSRWYDAENELAYISVSTNDEMVSKQILDKILADIIEQIPDSLKIFGEFDVVPLVTYSESKTNEKLKEMVITEQEHTMALREEIAGYEAELAELALTPVHPISMPTTTKVAISMVKHFVLGAAVGVILTVGVLYALFFLNGKLHSESQLAFYCDSFGYTFVSNSRKKKLRGIDKIIAKLESNGVLYSEDAAIHRLFANIKNSNEDIKSVMIVGNYSDKEKESIKKSVSGMKDLGLNVSVEGDILMDNKTFDNLAKCDAVVLVENLDKIPTDSIAKTIDQVTLENKKVVGCLINR